MRRSLSSVATALIALTPTICPARVAPPVFISSLAEWELRAAPLGNIGHVVSGYGETETALGTGKVHYRGTPLQVGSEWASWCCHYRGEVIYPGAGVSRRGLRLDDIAAIGFFVQPQAKRVEHITVSSVFGGQSWTLAVDGRGGARFVGIVGVHSPFIGISDEEGGAFAFGNFYFVTDRRGARPPGYSQDYQAIRR